MALSDLIAKASINPFTANPSRIESQLSQAEADLSSKRAILDSLLTSDAVNIDSPSVVKADEAVATAERRLKNLYRMLASAKAKLAAHEDERVRAEKAAHWRKVVEAAEARHAALKKLESSMATFASDYLAVLESNDTLRGLLPPDHDMYAALTDRAALETILRKELVRLNLRWCFSWPWPVVDLPKLTPQIEGALHVVLNLAARAQSTASTQPQLERE